MGDVRQFLLMKFFEEAQKVHKGKIVDLDVKLMIEKNEDVYNEGAVIESAKISKLLEKNMDFE